MAPPAARVTDMVLQDNPHCHAPIHPPAPTPTPVPHPPLPLNIVKGQPNVLIGSMMAARVTDITRPCLLPSSLPPTGSADQLLRHLLHFELSAATTFFLFLLSLF